jgi:hypothetical protein
MVALFAWAVPPVSLAEVDTGVIRLAQPTPPADADAEMVSPVEPRADARHGFDVEAFDSRFESLWFQHHLASGRVRCRPTVV